MNLEEFSCLWKVFFFLIFTNWKQNSVYLIACIIFGTEQQFHGRDVSELYSNSNIFYL